MIRIRTVRLPEYSVISGECGNCRLSFVLAFQYDCKFLGHPCSQAYLEDEGPIDFDSIETGRWTRKCMRGSVFRIRVFDKNKSRSCCWKSVVRIYRYSNQVLDKHGKKWKRK